MIFSRLRRAKILHCIREYLSDNFHFSGNYHSKPRTDTPFKLFHSPAFAPPAELKQASKMLGWEIPSPLEENPTHTYGKCNRCYYVCLEILGDVLRFHDGFQCHMHHVMQDAIFLSVIVMG